MADSVPQSGEVAKAKRAVPPPLPAGYRKPISPPSIPAISPPPIPKRGKNGKAGVSRKEILDPSQLDPYRDLLLFARLVVEGWLAGKHRSLDYGSNAEFVEHRNYMPGDPVSLVDWKVYARNRRLVIQKHRDEKDMTGYLLLDVSGSMSYQSGQRESKLVRAAKTTAALAYLMGRQGDKSSLALFHTEVEDYLEPGSTRRHLFDLVSRLQLALEKPKGKTAAHSAIDLCVPLFKKSGSLVVISDLLTDHDRLFDALAQFQYRKFKILLLHIVDPDEVHLPDLALARFVDLETKETIQVAPDEIRNAYRADNERITERLKEECLHRGITYHLLDTETPWQTALEAWLGQR